MNLLEEAQKICAEYGFDYETIVLGVKEGMAELDAHCPTTHEYPTWDSMIDLDHLDVGHISHCVLGQIAGALEIGTYTNMKQHLGWGMSEVYAWGFDTHEEDVKSSIRFDVLDLIWTHMIAERRGS